MCQIFNFIKESFQTKEFYSRDKQTLKKLVKSKNPSNHQLNVLRSQFFELAHNDSKDVDTIKTVTWLEEINKCLLPVKDKNQAENRCYFSPGDDCENAIVSCIRNAKYSVKICVFTISENVITNEIIVAKKRGVSVTIITDNDKLNDKGVNFSEEIAILEVCNPFEAKKVLEETILASYFLPCKLIVYSDEGSTKIGMTKPTSLIQLLEDKNLEEIASDIEVRLIKCIDQLS